MRKLKNNETGSTLNIKGFLILKNYWEYFVIDEDTGDENIAFCLVRGYETELGDVYLSELKPYVVSQTNNLADVLSPPGWSWV